MRKSKAPAVQSQSARPSGSTESPYPPDGDLSDYPAAEPVKTATKAVTGRLARALRGGS